MKRSLLFILMFLPFVIFAQKDYDSYFMAIPDKGNVKFDILVSDKKGSIDEVYIYAQSLDNSYSNSVLIISGKKLPVFKQYLIYVRDKFNEWKDKAEKNNVENFTKDIDVELKDTYKAAFGISDWNFDKGVHMRSIFSVKDGKSSLYITTGRLYSSSNSYIKSEGLVFFYTDTKQLDELINKLDVEKMANAINNVKETDSLFK